MLLAEWTIIHFEDKVLKKEFLDMVCSKSEVLICTAFLLKGSMVIANPEDSIEVTRKIVMKRKVFFEVT